MSISIESAPRFKVAGWYVCYWSNGYESWVFDTKAEAISFGQVKAQEIPEHHHLNVSWLSLPVKGRLSASDIIFQIYSRMDSTKLHDMRKVCVI